MEDAPAPVEEAVAPVDEAPEGTAEKEAAPGPPARLVPPKRLPRPDDTEFKAQIDKLQAELERCKARSEQLKVEIAAKHAKQRGAGPQQGIIIRLRDLRTQFTIELNKKKQIRTDLENVTAARNALRSQTRESRAKLQYLTADQIDAQITRLEQRMAHTTLSLAEEKKVLEDIKRLRASRANVAQYNARMEDLDKDDALYEQVLARLKAADAKLNELKAAEGEVRAELEAARASQQEEVQDLPQLYDERDQCRAVQDAAWAKMKELKAEHRVKLDEYYEREREFRKFRDEDRARKQEQYNAERAQRMKERRARDAELAGEPFDKEVTMCEQLTSYLGKFCGASTAPENGAVITASDPALEAPEGFKLAPKKGENEDLDAWLGGGKKPKGGKKGRAGEKKPDKQAAPDARLPHSIDMISAFARLKVEVPLTRAHIPVALGAVAARKAHFLDRRTQVKESGDYVGEEPAPEAAENGASAAPGPSGRSAPQLGAAGAATVELELVPAAGGNRVTVKLTPAQDDMDTEFPAL